MESLGPSFRGLAPSPIAPLYFRPFKGAYEISHPVPLPSFEVYLYPDML